MNELRIEKPYRRGDGHVGARATVTVDHPTRTQSYAFDTHGMSSSEVAAKVLEIEEYHATKTERLDRFIRLHGREMANGFVIVDCTILDAGVTLYVDVRPKVKGFPLRIAYHELKNVPTNDEILKMVAEKLIAERSVDDAHAEFVAKVVARRT